MRQESSPSTRKSYSEMSEVEVLFYVLQPSDEVLEVGPPLVSGERLDRLHERLDSLDKCMGAAIVKSADFILC